MYLGLLSLLLLTSCGSVNGQFESGATAAECVTLQPDGSTPATGTAPFIIAVTSGSYTPGGSAVQVFVASTNFMLAATGLVLQARRASNNADSSAFGSFDVPSDGNYRLQVCGTSQAGTITNTNNNSKSVPLSFMWNPPAENVGSIEFIASLVDSDGNFWSNIVSTTSLPSSAGELTALTIGTCPVPSVNNNIATWTDPNCFRGSEVQANSATCEPPSGSTFSVGSNTATCTCSDRGETASCEITITIESNIVDPCSSNPCQNGGTCTSVGLPNNPAFLCQCLAGFNLPTCTPSTGTDPCSPNPCNNGGTCFSVPAIPSGFFCQCPAGFPQPTCGDTATNTPPNSPNCPSNDVNEAVADGIPGTTVTYNTVQCMDAQDGTITAICSPSSLSFFLVGTTPVTCTCTDSGSLTSSCNFNVVVGPVAPACAGNPCLGNECRESSNSLAGYTCHSVTGTPCVGL